MRTTLPLRAKKLIGMIYLVLLVFVYAICAVTVAGLPVIADKPWYVHMAFFGFSGILWILPAMWIISWMSKETG